jgi:hypothetical protein
MQVVSDYGNEPGRERIGRVKEDVLEQIVDDYLKFGGYFTTHNVRFRPSVDHPDYVRAQDAVPSDVDVVGYHPTKTGLDRVVAVSCKSWQVGFNATSRLEQLRGTKRSGRREAWRTYREVWVPKWSEAFRQVIYELTGARNFVYRIAVTRLSGDPTAWAADPTIARNLQGCDVGFLTLEEMWATMLAELKRTPAPSEIGRLAQLLKAAGLTAPSIVAPPSGPEPGSDAEAVAQAEQDA